MVWLKFLRADRRCILVSIRLWDLSCLWLSSTDGKLAPIEKPFGALLPKPHSFGDCVPIRIRAPKRVRRTEALPPQAPFLRELCAPCPHEGVLRNTPYDPRRSRRSPLSIPLSLNFLGASLLLLFYMCVKVGSSWYKW